MLLPVKPDDGLRSHPNNWTSAPEKANTHCFYCKQSVPNHAEDCHVPQRTVLVEFKTKMVIEVPANWDENMINFFMNESSSCSSRYVEQLFLETEQKENLCNICHRTEMTYLREASEEDHETFAYLPEDKEKIIREKLLKE